MGTKAAKKVLDAHWDRKLPVDVFRLALAAGAQVQPDELMQESGQFSFHEGTPIIRYNPTEADVRQRFTIAHELGHFLLNHGKSFRDTPTQFSTANYDPREVEANRFAAELLMPSNIIRLAIMEKSITQVARLAKAFGVSEAAMMYRLKNLGWIS